LEVEEIVREASEVEEIVREVWEVEEVVGEVWEVSGRDEYLKRRASEKTSF
jgi:hypothetical protein